MLSTAEALAPAPPVARKRLLTDLSTALQVATRSKTPKTRKAQGKIFAHWQDFCNDIQVPETLDIDLDQDTKVAYLLVFALRYREKGLRGQPVRADTVSKALLAVGQGITNLGGLDPRMASPGSKQYHPILHAYLSALRDEDDPSKRAYPANLTIIRALIDYLDTDDPEFGTVNTVVIDLIIIAYYWLLRPAEYTETEEENSRSQAFRFQDVYLTIGDKLHNAINAPLNDVNSIMQITHATLTFTDQKNAVRGEQVGHKATSDPFFCPAKALGRLVRRLQHWRAPPDTPLHQHFNSHIDHRQWYTVKAAYITNGLRHAAQGLQPTTGIDYTLLSARSIRPGGATALMCADIDPDYVGLLGRWKSDAMFRYLRTQAATYHKHLSQKMLDHGHYTFAPGTYIQPDALPIQAPPQLAALLAHEELYSDEE